MAIIDVALELIQGGATDPYRMREFASGVPTIAFTDVLLRAPRGITHLASQPHMLSTKPFSNLECQSPDFTDVLIELESLIRPSHTTVFVTRRNPLRNVFVTSMVTVL